MAIVRNNIGYNQAGKILLSTEVGLRTVYKQAYNNITSQLRILYDNMGNDVSFSEANKYKRLQKLSNNIKEILTLTAKGEIEVTKIGIVDTANMMVNSWEFSTGLSGRFAVLPANNIRALLYNPLDLIKWDARVAANVNLLTARTRSTLTQSLIRGDSYGKAAKQLQKIVNIGFNKAVTIARTEMHRAQNEGTLIGYESLKTDSNRLGYTYDKHWQSIVDDRSRNNHAQLNGIAADKDGKWTVGGVKTKAPGMTGLAKEDINCRCRTYVTVNGQNPKPKISWKKFVANQTKQPKKRS